MNKIFKLNIKFKVFYIKMKITKIGKLIILNVIFSQISNSFIFSFIESLVLELVEEFLIKILPDSIFNTEPYYNRSYVLRMRDLSVYNSSQTNIIMWTSIIGAYIFYYMNKKMSKKNKKEEKNENEVNFSDLYVLFFFYVISLISLIFLFFIPMKKQIIIIH